MKKIFLLLLLTFSLTCITNAQNKNEIVIAKKDSVNSSILKEKRNLLVYTPDINSGEKNNNKKYPVLYLLDGDAHIQSVAGLVQQLSQVNGNTIVPEMIIVAIPNTDRTRDLTPTHITSDPPMMDSNFSKNTGGGPNFAAFLEKELIPYIDSAYPTQPYRVLIGHSFGGLSVMQILTDHPNMFNGYIAIDPSMWYDKEQFLKTTEKKLTAQNFPGKKLYLGIANTMPEGMTLDKMKKDTSMVTRHIRSIFALDQYIKSKQPKGLQFASKFYEEDDHGSVPLISEYDGLRFIFNGYKFKMEMSDFFAPGIGMIERMRKHYQKLTTDMGYKVAPDEMFINGMGYQFLSMQQLDKAAALFEMNIENYPESGNVYDSYADCLMAKKDTAAAITQYKKALSITGSEDTRQKLDRLLNKSTYKPSVKDLEKYAGAYEFDVAPITATTYIKDETLWANATGQGDMELVPVSPHVFTIKTLPGYTLQFNMEGDKVVSLTATQPQGVFTARRKE
ncbi:MAG TPA: alpha/beta hydrolase-fold protein [Chitinophagaceae bacterium]|nr:alpha/beta hydrolase-fold protein [Chitinophagaceae bacterium]